MSDTTDWTLDYFDDPYTELHPFPDAAQTDREVETLLTLLPPGPARVLDVGCGPGRHALRLAQRGYRVIGVDTSLRFLAEARADAQDLAEIEFLQLDMRSLNFEAEFDAALSLFTAWGYFSDQQNQQILERVARALRPGGRLIMDLAPRDWLVRLLDVGVGKVCGEDVSCIVVVFDCEDDVRPDAETARSLGGAEREPASAGE
jgi:SAM-dependent methyltransferase